MKTHTIQYTELLGPDELDPEDQDLLERARQALPISYSPYSRFRVGAAIRLADGRVIAGANQENAAYPVCMCAEQTTVSAARTQCPDVRIMAMAITVSGGTRPVDLPVSPCGQCRQLLAEQEKRDKAPIRLILQGETGPIRVFSSASHLLPFAFTGEWL